MRKRSKKGILSTLLIAGLLLTGFLGRAQCNDEFGDPDVNCPIDGGVIALLAVGVAYGWKKYKTPEKQPLEENDSNPIG